MAFGLVGILLFVCWNSRTTTANSSPGSQQKPLPYYLLEELPANTLIGNVIVDAKLRERYPEDVMSNLSYRIFKQVDDRGQTVTLFDVDESTGIMKTAVRIDRDEICPKRENCLVYLDIAVYPRQYYYLIQTVVEILDVNDHVPKFPEAEILLRLPESARPGATLDLPEAVDPDGVTFGIEHYELVSSTSKFGIRVTPAEHPTDIKLVIREKLNHEQANFYQFKVVAYDGGTPPKFGALLVNVQVEVDSQNDKNPTSDAATYEIYVRENTAVGTTIGKIGARELEADINDTLTYRFSESTNKSLDYLFGIRPHSGAIYLKGELDFELAQKYVLMVIANDSSALTLSARVVITVEDENDHAPEIAIDTKTSSGVAMLFENAEVGTFVAEVSLIDPDDGDNGRVSCALDQAPPFRIMESGQDQYRISLATGLSRDMPRLQTLKVVCHDLGSKPLSSTAEVKVLLTKPNSHRPQFSRESYTAAIVENNRIGEKVTVVMATDPDDGQNGKVRYKLWPDDSNKFRIDPETGLITANVTFDHEQTRSIDLKVIAFDLGNPVSLSSTVVVTVTVVDVDDELPEFTEDFFAFGTFENEPPGTDVGMVTAEDRDSAPYNQFTYHFINGSHDAVDLFTMNPITGHIYTKASLDREDRPVYYLTAVAISPTDRTHTSTVSVTIYVADKNDNRPTVTWPTADNNTIYVSSQLPPDSEIGQVLAFDRDLGSNSKLAYTLRPHSGQVFDINLATGVLTTKTDLSLVGRYRFDLDIQVSDHGFPRLMSETRLHVIVNGSLAYAAKQQTVSVIYTNNNTTIIASLTSASLLLVFLLIVAIVLIKRQQEEKKASSYTTNTPPNTTAASRLESQIMLTSRDDHPDGREYAECMTSSRYLEHKDNGLCQSIDESEDNLHNNHPSQQHRNIQKTTNLEVVTSKQYNSQQLFAGSTINCQKPVDQCTKGSGYHGNDNATNQCNQAFFMTCSDV